MSVFSPDVNVDAVNVPVPVELQDGSGNPISSTGGSLNTNVTNTVTVTGTVTANLGTIDGAATAANQTTIIANQATQIADLVTIATNQTNGSQHTIVDNFPADADALAQGSTTTGQLGALVMGAVTTAAPVYVTGKTDPLSIDTAGNLRVVSASTVSSTDTVVQITSTGANQVLLAANLARKKAILYFESGIWNVKFGAGASAVSKTYMVSTSNTSIEVLVWVGEIDALCTTSGKLVDVTELL